MQKVIKHQNGFSIGSKLLNVNVADCRGQKNGDDTTCSVNFTGFDWTGERAATLLSGCSLTRAIANERAAPIPLSQSDVSAVFCLKYSTSTRISYIFVLAFFCVVA